jgi:hypothetical protein
MIVAIIILSIICFFLILGLIWSLKKNLALSEKFESVVEQIENSLDVLDSCYQRATTRAKLEVLSDEPVVRELLEDIQVTRDAILLVANLMIEPLEILEEKEQ